MEGNFNAQSIQAKVTDIWRLWLVAFGSKEFWILGSGGARSWHTRSFSPYSAKLENLKY